MKNIISTIYLILINRPKEMLDERIPSSKLDKRLANYLQGGGLRAFEPIRQIAEDAGKEGSVVMEKVKQEKGAFGFDADKEEYVDMMEAGIIDPTKVVRLALQNAASVASLLVTTEAVVAEKSKKEPPVPPMPPPEY